MTITFGIVTGGGQTGIINEIIDSIEEEHIPQYEIIIVGSFHSIRKNTIALDFPEHVVPMWITKKKNLIGQIAKYDTLVFLHDYIKLEKGWFSGFQRFDSEHPEWEVAMCKMLEINGNRSIDWMGLPNDTMYGNVLFPYSYSNPKGMYVPGNFFMVKRQLFLKYPLDENRVWGMGEDIEWSKRIFGGADNSEWLRNILRIPMNVEVPDPDPPAKYCMNIYSSVRFLKEKPTNPCYYEIFDLHSGDNSRPPGFRREIYYYLKKRDERKIESNLQYYMSIDN